MNTSHRLLLVIAVCLGSVPHALAAGDTSPELLAQHWAAQAGRPGDAQQGARFFTQRHGGEWSCASCHGTPPTRSGEHAGTGKPIAALAPIGNPQGLRSVAKAEKWFRRNCKDVLARECSAAEKADVLAYLVGLR